MISRDQEVGTRVRLLRKGRGWSLRTLSEKVDLSYVYLGEMERGDKPWKVEHIARVAEALTISPSLLQDPSVPLERLETIAAILSKLAELPEEQLVAVDRLLDTLVPQVPNVSSLVSPDSGR